MADIQTDPRSAHQNAWNRGLARIAVPVALIGLLTTGAAVAAWPEPQANLQPAEVAQAAGGSVDQVATSSTVESEPLTQDRVSTAQNNASFPRPSFQTAFDNSATAQFTSAGLSYKRCRSGSAMERGLKRDAIRVHRALCARFPQIKSYGGRRAGGGSFHGTGRAVDAMISGATGWKVARWVRANRKALGVSEVIYSRRIWTVQRSGDGWRTMSDRGNRTANHFDHVHISVYGNRGTS